MNLETSQKSKELKILKQPLHRADLTGYLGFMGFVGLGWSEPKQTIHF